MAEYEIRVGFGADNKKITVDDESNLKPWDLDTKLRVVGTDQNRVDGLAKASGRAKYTFDVNLPGMLYGAILRSPHPKATLVSVDLTEAMKSPGVKAAIQYMDDGSQIRFLGHEVAGVAAETMDAAYDALEKISASYDVESHNTDYLKAEGAPTVDGTPVDGMEITEPWPSEGAEQVEQALAQAAQTHEATYKTEVQTHSSLETHGVVCQWNGNDLEVWASTQGTFSMQAGLNQTLGRLLPTPPTSVRVHTEFMGGGFGGKLSAGTEPVICALLAKAADAPVKLMLNRYEEHTCVGHRPGALMQIRAGMDRDGKLTVWDYRSYGDPGFSGSGSTTFPVHYVENTTQRSRGGGRGGRGRGGGGPRMVQDLRTDNNAGRAMRAPGWPQGYFAAEVFMDEMARKAGMDPLEFRVLNDPQVIRQEQWQAGADRFGWKERRNPEPGKPQGSETRYLRGAGLSSARWGGMGSRGRGNPNQATCRIHSDGTVESRNGAQDIGTGMKTVMALITAEELQIPVASVRVTMGDTNDPSGPGSGGSTTTPSLAPAVRHAAGLAKAQLVEKVAEYLKVGPGQVVYEDGSIGVSGGRMLSFADACKLIGPNPISATGERFDNYESYNNGVCGCQFAEVEVDSWTGVVKVKKMLAIQDCGLVIARKLAESQVIGAMIQGLSYALFENRQMDHRAGRMLNGDMLFYKIAGPGDMPEMEALMFSVPNGANNVGAVGLGEPPSVAAPAAVANAVANACGVPVRSLPITPDKVLKALSQRKGV